MLNKILLPILILLSITACKKDDNTRTDNTPPPSVTPTTDNSYNVSGHADINIKNIDSASLTLDIKPTGEEKKAVALTISGLPDNTTTEFSTNNAAIPYSTTLKIYTGGTALGSYPITISAKAPSSVSNKYSFNLNVTEESIKNCDSFFLAGAKRTALPITLTEDSTLVNVSNLTPPQIVNASSSPRISLLVLQSKQVISYADGDIIFLHLNCNDGTMSIDQQNVRPFGATFSYFNVKGEGKIDFVNNTYRMQYTSTKLANGTPTTSETFILKGTLKY